MSTVFNSNPLSITVSNDLVVTAIFEPDDASNTQVIDKVFISTGGQDVSEIVLQLGQSVDVYVTAIDKEGNAITQANSMEWASTTPSVADFTVVGAAFNNGISFATLRATANGVSVIQASLDNVPSNAITVKVGTPSIQITPSAVEVAKNTTAQLSAVYRTEAGDIDNSKGITWESSAPAIATVTQNGLVTGINTGDVTVTATANGLVSSANITVTAPSAVSLEITPLESEIFVGKETTFTAIVTDAAGNILPNRKISWSTANVDIVNLDTRTATVEGNAVTLSSLSSGLITVTGLKVGETSIRAQDVTNSSTIDTAIANFAFVTVKRLPFTIQLSPENSTIFVSNTQQLIATILDEEGSAQTYAIERWETSNPSIASVSATGLVTGISAGTVSVRAFIGNTFGEATVTVSAQATPDIASISVVPKNSTINVNQDRTLSAIVLDTQGNTVSRVLQWVSDSPTIATVDVNGKVLGISSGQAVITAKVRKNNNEELTDTANVIVVAVSASPTPTPSPSPTPRASEVPTPSPTPTPQPSAVLWRDCASGNLNQGTPPNGYIQAIYIGAGGGFCWEPSTTVGFNPSLAQALEFEYQRGSSLYPQPKTVTATNPSYAKSYRISLTTNSGIAFLLGNNASNGTLSFNLGPRQNISFVINVSPELLDILGDGRSSINLTVSIEDL